MDKFKYKIGANLREIPENIDDYKKGIALLEEEIINTSELKQKAQKLSKLGVLYRIIGALDKSSQTLMEASKLISQLNDKPLLIVNKIRIGQTLQFQNKNDEADECFEKIETEILLDKIGIHLLDFVYQHRGKNLYEQGKIKEATHYITKALVIRKKKGNPELIKSSEFALQTISERE